MNTLAITTFVSAGAVLALAGLLLYILLLVTVYEPVDPPYVPRHLKSDYDILAELDFEITQELTTEFLATPVSVGRHAISSPVRHVMVPPNWAPPIGNIRITLLETPTAEYLFARKPKDQLSLTRTQYVYAGEKS